MKAQRVEIPRNSTNCPHCHNTGHLPQPPREMNCLDCGGSGQRLIMTQSMCKACSGKGCKLCNNLGVFYRVKKVMCRCAREGHIGKWYKRRPDIACWCRFGDAWAQAQADAEFADKARPAQLADGLRTVTAVVSQAPTPTPAPVTAKAATAPVVVEETEEAAAKAKKAKARKAKAKSKKSTKAASGVDPEVQAKVQELQEALSSGGF